MSKQDNVKYVGCLASGYFLNWVIFQRILRHTGAPPPCAARWLFLVRDSGIMELWECYEG